VPSETYAIAVAAVLGAAVGSFLNVCILRLPANESLVKPRSRCPKCGYQLAWYDNVPILSWLSLGGKCRRCRAGISVQYPLVEAVVAVLWGTAVWHFGPTFEAVVGAAFGTILLGIAVTDARHYLIPDEYTLGGGLLGLAVALREGLPGLFAAVVGAAAGFFLLLIVAWAGEKAFGKEAMGGGDIKMMAMVGTFVGWKGVLLTVFGGALLGTLVFVPLTLRHKKLVPFGVFLAAAAAATWLFGDRIIGWYLAYALGGS
jgi:leader peptidase (prepilin peptidase)/N-methyltransferase